MTISVGFAMAEPAITLQFRHAATVVRADLSAVRQVGPHLWLGCDETATLERLTLNGAIANDHQHIFLGDFLKLPDDPDDEVDIEGIAYEDHYLWVTGSHSVKRKRPKPEYSPEENLERLATLEQEANRYLLGRIPLVDGQLFQACPHPERPDETLTAAQIKPKKGGDRLSHALRDDPHLGPFLKANIPGKDNGFDIEGLAVRGPQVWVGLRGPVLRGWATLLELSLKPTGSGHLKLRKWPDSKLRYRKRFLNLHGLGIRDLCFWGEDLLILAGPTMDLDGPVQIFSLSPTALDSPSPLLEPTPLWPVPYGNTTDHAEGVTLLGDRPDTLLVIYDSPAPERLVQETGVRADCLSLKTTPLSVGHGVDSSPLL